MKDFIRKMTLSAVVTLCIIFGLFGMCKAYEGIRQIGFGEYRNAIEFEDGKVKIFDYEI